MLAFAAGMGAKQPDGSKWPEADLLLWAPTGLDLGQMLGQRLSIAINE